MENPQIHHLKMIEAIIRFGCVVFVFYFILNLLHCNGVNQIDRIGWEGSMKVTWSLLGRMIYFGVLFVAVSCDTVSSCHKEIKINYGNDTRLVEIFWWKLCDTSNVINKIWGCQSLCPRQSL